MPILLDERRLIIEFADLWKRSPIHRPAEPPERAPGAHQSDILQHIARKLGKLKPNEPLEEDIPERMLLGYMWEEFYFSMRPDADWQPGEVTLDGISVNCDGLGNGVPCDLPDVQFEQLYLIETKCTEKKVRTGADFLDEWIWMHQGRAYCYSYSEQIDVPIDVVQWVIMYYRGDWRGSGPVIMEYLVQFTEQEKEQTWTMLKRYKDEAMAELAAVDAAKPKAALA